jgi:ATP-dependent Lon protease
MHRYTYIMVRKTMVDTRSTNKSKTSDKKHNKKRNEEDSDSESSEDERWETEDDEDDEDDEERDSGEETLGESDSDEEESDEEEDDDESYVPPKKNKKRNKFIVESDEEDEDDEEDSITHDEFQEMLAEMFPSKYMKKKVDSNKNSTITKKDKKDKKTKKDKKDKKTKKDKKQKKRRHEVSSEDESEDEDYDEEDEDEEEGIFNILLSLGGEGDDEEEYYEDDEDDDCDSEDEEQFMKENYTPGETTPKKKTKKTKKKKTAEEEDIEIVDNAEQEYLDLIETKKMLTKQLSSKPNNKVMKRALKDCNKNIKELVKDARNKNAKTYHKLIHADKKKTNEIDYFKKKLSNKQQLQVMRDLKEINKHTNITKPYRLRLLDSTMPPKFKAIAMQKLNMLKNMDPGDNEYFKIKNWVDTFMKIPFGVNRSLDVNINHGVDVCHDFMQNAYDTLNKCVYGLNDAKMQIMQMAGQWISNPSAMGTAIAIKGPMGTGKTTLVKEGISKILGREFTFIALGGTGDSSFLEGHSYTYEGSSWGKIVQILIDSKCMNPVIYFDELDKVSDTPKGEEIIGILTHLTDTSQNSEFHDKYFSDVNFDLSKCLFIFSYNDESKVNPILRDRMYCIQTKGYEQKEKITIARNYLLPSIRSQINFGEQDITIPDETLSYIISKAELTKEESGVRNLKRCLEIIHTKLNLFRLMKPGVKLFDEELELDVTFPFTVTTKDVDILIKHKEQHNQSMLAMYV